MCQPMPIVLFLRWDLDSRTNGFTPGQSKTCCVERKVMSYFQRTRPECKTESFYDKKLTAAVLLDLLFCYHFNVVFEVMGCFYHLCPCQEMRSYLIEKDIQCGIKKRKIKELRRRYIQKKPLL